MSLSCRSWRGGDLEKKLRLLSMMPKYGNKHVVKCKRVRGSLHGSRLVLLTLSLSLMFVRLAAYKRVTTCFQVQTCGSWLGGL